MAKKPRIFFLATPALAVPTLCSLATNKDITIVGVGVPPDKPVGRKQIKTPCPVKISAEKLGLPWYEIADKAGLKRISAMDFDLGLVLAFGLIFPATILAMKPFVNVHFSLLPQWRGASPVQAAIRHGQVRSGLTCQKMVPQLDAGDILLQREYDIAGKNTLEVWTDFGKKTAEISAEFLQLYFGQKLSPQSQIESQATICHKLKKSDGLIIPRQETATDIWRKFQAFVPWPGIYLQTKYGLLQIKQCSLKKQISAEIFALPCANQTKLCVQTVQLAGKKVMSVRELLNGYPDILREVSDKA